MFKKTGLKTKEESQNYKRQFILILAVTVVVGTIITMVNEGFILDSSGEEARLLINHLLDTTLPDNITNIQLTYPVILGPELEIFIRFDAAPKHVRSWITSGVACFFQDLEALEINGKRHVGQSIIEQEIGTTRDWWQPEAANQYAPAVLVNRELNTGS
jgi:hypothetical protein